MIIIVKKEGALLRLFEWYRICIPFWFFYIFIVLITFLFFLITLYHYLQLNSTQLNSTLTSHHFYNCHLYKQTIKPRVLYILNFFSLHIPSPSPSPSPPTTSNKYSLAKSKRSRNVTRCHNNEYFPLRCRNRFV